MRFTLVFTLNQNTAQSVPAGWKTVTDMRKVCQIAVPADWTPDALLTAFSHRGSSKKPPFMA
jgi:hypothetical protein